MSMSLRPQLTFQYGHSMCPLSATCSVCGAVMPLPPANLTRPADIVMWLSRQFIEHKRETHSQLKSANNCEIP